MACDKLKTTVLQCFAFKCVKKKTCTFQIGFKNDLTNESHAFQIGFEKCLTSIFQMRLGNALQTKWHLTN